MHTRAHNPTTLARLARAHKRYGAQIALQSLDLEVHAGEVLALLGPNGAGKTTALGLLTGRIAPDGGSAQLFGRDPRDAATRRGIGVMLQEAQLPDTLTVEEQVRLFASYYPQPRAVDETLRLAGLSDLGRRKYGQLSGGQQRRVQFALAIAGRPALLFVDEPTTGLDVEARRGFWSVLRELRAEGVAIVLTTHYLEEADALADRIVLLGNGRVLAEGTPQAIKSRVAGKRLRCRTSLTLAQLGAFAEVESVQRSGELVELRSRRPEDLLRHLLAADTGMTDLELLPLSLEEAFLSLTAPMPLEQAA
jgi:ABC-2 type transport system ATP-binding protein